MSTQGSRFAERVCSALAAAALALILSVPAHARSGAGPAAASSSLVQAAQRQFDSGDYAAAISTLQSAVSQNSSDADAYFWLARSYFEMHDFDSAIAQGEKAVAIDGKRSVYHQWLGRAYGEKADRDHSFLLARRVKKEFEAAVQLNPSNISARRDLEEYCIEAPWIVGGSKDEALAQVNAIAALDPVQGHLARAVYLLEQMKKPDQAEAEYRQVLSAAPGSVAPYLEAADFFIRQNKPSDVRAAIQAAAAVKSNDPRLAYYRGVAGVLADSDLTGAEQELKSYLASTPDRSDWPSHAAARIWLGRLYESQGKRADAAEQYRAALQLNPKLREARAQLEKLEKASP